MRLDLADLPVELTRELFDALQLRIDYDHHTRTAHGQITLTELSTGTLVALVSPDVAPVIDIRAVRARHGAGNRATRPRYDTTGVPRGLRVEHQWASPRR